MALTGHTVAQAWHTPQSSPSTSASFFAVFFLDADEVGDILLASSEFLGRTR